MRNLYISILLGILVTNTAFAQNIDNSLAEAKSAYRGGNLDDARFALQQALHEVDIAIGQEVLKILPTKVGNLAYSAESDNVSGMGGSFVGLLISRDFGKSDEDANANIQIMSDSPLLAGINAILSLPAIGGLGDPNQKRIRVDGYRGLMQKSDDSEGRVSWDVQIPFSSSLLTFRCEGVKNENDVMSMVNSIPISKIAEMIK
jgi:hypothetical protein